MYEFFARVNSRVREVCVCVVCVCEVCVRLIRLLMGHCVYVCVCVCGGCVRVCERDRHTHTHTHTHTHLQNERAQDFVATNPTRSVTSPLVT